MAVRAARAVDRPAAKAAAKAAPPQAVSAHLAAQAAANVLPAAPIPAALAVRILAVLVIPEAGVRPAAARDRRPDRNRNRRVHIVPAPAGRQASAPPTDRAGVIRRAIATGAGPSGCCFRACS